jgi:hypothetical protein
VYSVHGHYVGWVSDEPRILRKQSSTFVKPLEAFPPVPAPIKPPASTPLAPMMPELPYGVIDVLDDAVELLPSFDFGDLREFRLTMAERRLERRSTISHQPGPTDGPEHAGNLGHAHGG